MQGPPEMSDLLHVSGIVLRCLLDEIEIFVVFFSFFVLISSSVALNMNPVEMLSSVELSSFCFLLGVAILF